MSNRRRDDPDPDRRPLPELPFWFLGALLPDDDMPPPRTPDDAGRAGDAG